jgi:phosphoribosylanthranilate isomerase
MLTKTVKISNVTNLSDARYCAGMGVEMLGFSIDENSATYISPKKFEDICSWLAGVTLVAETSLSDAKQIIEKLAGYPVHAVQVESPDLLNYLQGELGLPLILKISVDTYDADEVQAIVDRYESHVAHFLFESDQNAELNDSWVRVLENCSEGNSLLIGFGLETEFSVNTLTDVLPSIGIALRGGDEIRPGFKDFGSMMDILEALEEQ